jgi:hypothetical protein
MTMKRPEQFNHITTIDQWNRISMAIIKEVHRAEKSYPEWPIEIDRGVALMAEEAGEAVKAANDHLWHFGTKTWLKKKLVQTAAMCVRMLAALEPKVSG